MKKTLLLLLTALSAASFAFAGGDACADKSKCDDKAKDCCCCKDAKDCKDAKAATCKKPDDKAATKDADKK